MAGLLRLRPSMRMDRDFHIYNDVRVHAGDGSYVIYGYLEALFPPTNNHTATLVDDFIYHLVLAHT